MEECIKYVKIFKACSDERRLMILNIIKDEEKCACDIMDMLGIAQSALSYHMNILCESGIVKQRKDGKWTYYSINGEAMVFAQDMFENFIIYK